MSYIPSCIKSVQTVTCTFNGSSGTATATLSPSVTAANCLLVPMGTTPVDNSGSVNQADIYNATLSNTQVTASCGAGTPGNGSLWTGTVIEFYSIFVKSSGIGTIAIGDLNDSGTVNITAVNTAKTALILTGFTLTAASAINIGGTTYPYQYITPYLVLTSSTVITANLVHDANNSNIKNRAIGYSYVEFR